MTCGHADPGHARGLEPCEGLVLSTSSWTCWEGPLECGRRTCRRPGAASMGSNAAVHLSGHRGAALVRLSRRETNVQQASSAAAPPKEVGVVAGRLPTGPHVRVFVLPPLPEGPGRLRDDQVPSGARMTSRTGAAGFSARGVARAPRRPHAGCGFGRAMRGAAGSDEGRASGDPIRAAA